MAVLVGVKLLRQFTVELGEIVGVHLLHSGHEDVDRGVQKLVDDVDLVTMNGVIGRTGPHEGFHLLDRSLVYFLLNCCKTLGFVSRVLCLLESRLLLIGRVGS